MTKTLAIVFGVVFLLIGILGFFTGSDGMLLGIFHVDTLHNIVHLVSGAAAIFAAMSGAMASRRYFQIFGVIYALVTILGFVYGDKNILGVMANNMADVWLHLVIALVALYAGFVANDEEKAMA